MIGKITRSFFLRWFDRSKGLRIGMFSVCERTHFGSYNKVHKFVRLKNVRLGDLTYVANGARIQNASLGKFCSIGPNCRIGLGAHPTRDFISSHPSFYSTSNEASLTFVAANLFKDHAEVNIGSDVWIGEGALILDGISVGDGSIVGAGAVVTKNVPPYAIVAGVPARIIRYRFDEPDIAFLSRIKWWDRDIEWLRRNAHHFTDIRSFRALMDVE